METIITILSGLNKERLNLFDIWYRYYYEFLDMKNIIVVSQNKYPDLSKYKISNHIKIKTTNKLFNRSMCINRGVLASQTEKCIISDADILIPKYNINFFLKSLNNYNFCIPYNYCIDFSKKETGCINFKKLKGGKVRQHKNALKGGVLFCNRSEFLKIKGYDENFWGWGAEDDAFYEKITKISKLYRPDNNTKIYHMFHEIIGRGKNPHHPKNLALYKKYKKMSKKELLKYLEIKL